MRHLLQRPFPDELLTSALLRTARRIDTPISVVMQQLVGRKWRPGYFQSGHLVEIGRAMGMEPMALLWHHSVFPYATAFMEANLHRKSLVTAMAEGTAARGIGATVQSVSDHVRYRRYCLRCAEEDRSRWGESYWHRSHHLPGVLLCLEHGTPLRETLLGTSGSSAWFDLLPHETRGKRTTGTVNDFDRGLARRSIAVLHRAPTSASGRTPDWYRAALIERGMLSPHRQVSEPRLIAWAKHRLGRDPRAYGFSNREAKLEWLILMVRVGVHVPFVSLKHLVLETALDADGGGTAAILDHVPSGPSAANTKEADGRYAKRLVGLTSRYVDRQEIIKVAEALKQVNAWQAYRHSRNSFPKLRAAVLAHRQSLASARRTHK